MTKITLRGATLALILMGGLLLALVPQPVSAAGVPMPTRADLVGQATASAATPIYYRRHYRRPRVFFSVTIGPRYYRPYRSYVPYYSYYKPRRRYYSRYYDYHPRRSYHRARYYRHYRDLR